MVEETCHCGQPLHYTDLTLRHEVEEIVDKYGPLVTVSVPGEGSFRVPRHFIALHGLKAVEVPSLGFERV